MLELKPQSGMTIRQKATTRTWGVSTFTVSPAFLHPAVAASSSNSKVRLGKPFFTTEILFYQIL
jgi:hypothetical protein